MFKPLIVLVASAIMIAQASSCSDSKPESRVGTVQAEKQSSCLKLKTKEEREECKKDTPKPDDPGPAPGPAPAPSPGTSALIEGEDTITWRSGATALSAEESLEFLKDSCGGCHDKEKGDQKSFWAFDSENYTEKMLSTDTMAPSVYFTMIKKAKGVNAGAPSAMPQVKLKDASMKKLKGTLLWMEKSFPLVVQTAYQKFDKNSKDSQKYGTGVILNYKCSKPATRRQFIRRFTNDVFSREPNADETKLMEEFGKLDEEVKKADREALAKKLFDEEDWKKEFTDKGLKKFADKIADVGQINAFGTQISADQSTDLRSEFYQKVKKDWGSKTWRDILLDDTVMVTPRTATLYGCDVPDGDWGPCTMKPPRGSFFGTIGYLRSRPMSLLVAPYNYGRAATMHFVISGDVFPNANNGPAGDEVESLPSCLKSKDYRATKTDKGFAPFGALAVPSSGNFCQSCHIARQMAAGSMLFRPFNDAGIIYGSSSDLDVVKDPQFALAINNDPLKGQVVKNRLDWKGDAGDDINEAFIRGLLDINSADEKACVPASEEGGNDKDLASIRELAEYIVDDGSVLAGGLARHMPRALSNLPITSEEILVKVNKAYTEGKGKLIPVFQAYLSSETYACGTQN